MPVDAGGTGGSTAEQARINLGLKSLATLDKAPIDQGGTGGATAAEARQNLGLSAAAASFTGAASAAPGTPGLVPAPAAGDQDKVLRGDGTWGTPQAGGSRFFGELVMLASRQSSPNGVIKMDGQLISNATAQYPAAVADLKSSTPSVPVVTPSVWLSDPLSRASWAYDAANDQIRMPDWNGVQPGSIGPLMFRGDGTLGFAPGKARMDQIQNITGSFCAANNVGFWPNAVGTGAFLNGSTNMNRGYGIGTSSTTDTRDMTFDASRSVRTGTEVLTKHGVGVWGVVLFGAVSNPGAADAAALATSYANQQTAIGALTARLSNLEAGTRFEKLWEGSIGSPGTITLSRNLRVGDVLCIRYNDGNTIPSTLFPVLELGSKVVLINGGVTAGGQVRLGNTAQNTIDAVNFTSGYGFSQVLALKQGAV